MQSAVNTRWGELPELLTAGEAASFLRVSARQVNRLCREGKLPAGKVGNAWRVNRDALRARCNAIGADA